MLDLQIDLKKYFKNIEKINSYSDLENLYNDLKLEIKNDKYFLNEKKYPKIGFTITKAEIENLGGTNFSLSNEIEVSTHNPLEKLLLSILWKNGDFGKESHIIEGILDKGDLENKNSGLVFYQFGKKLRDPKNEPIIDQHIMRAYLLNFNPNNIEIETIRRKKELSKKDAKDISSYIKWANFQANRVKNKKEEVLYLIDKILFALGKYIKIN